MHTEATTRAVCFEHDQHRFEFINERRVKELSPEAELYGERMGPIAIDSAARLARTDRKKIICKPCKPNSVSMRYVEYRTASAPSIAGLKDSHVHAD
ncbi:hypothetical protein [Methylocapsa palsarum]|uniref:Uncharacterized protein n=1 Tax=Methylocapsa palsarum TaxID=1612308 RepID=A0A1I3XTJ4_9HYPH|nr:hypothetical protein [Methylocapsa palsarum]SFK22888.1 hypothetical protein SAMN05444581_10474 [Methylocapsa palsarum]